MTHLSVLSLFLVAAGGLALSHAAGSAPDDRLFTGDGALRLIGQATGGQGQGGAGAGGAGGDSGGFDAKGLPVGPAAAATIPVPVQITGVLNRSAQVCDNVPREYAIDCVVVHLKQAISVTPQTGDYAEVRKVLSDTVVKLERIVADNRDETKPLIRLQTGGAGGPATARMRAIRPETVNRANADAARVLAEAQTVLLRSSSAQTRAKLEYVRIAEAVGSNKVLLRS